MRLSPTVCFSATSRIIRALLSWWQIHNIVPHEVALNEVELQWGCINEVGLNSQHRSSFDPCKPEVVTAVPFSPPLLPPSSLIYYKATRVH